MTDSKEVQFALEAVREAGKLVQTIQQEMVTGALTKDDRSPVTVGDFAAQAVVSRMLADTFGEVRLVGEESAAALREEDGRQALERVTNFVQRKYPDATEEAVCDWIDHGSGEASERFWTLDPIDGTKGFLRKDQYCIAFAYMVEHKPQVGAMACPSLDLQVGELSLEGGSVFFAVAGEGAWVTGMEVGSPRERLRTSGCDSPKEARLLGSYESAHTSDEMMVRFREVLGTQADPVRMDSQAKYALLAAGKGELLIRFLSKSRPDYKEKIWDHAAGALVVSEAGGRVSDLDGKDLDFSHGKSLQANRGILVSNGKLHEAALETIKAIGA